MTPVSIVLQLLLLKHFLPVWAGKESALVRVKDEHQGAKLQIGNNPSIQCSERRDYGDFGRFDRLFQASHKREFRHLAWREPYRNRKQRAQSPTVRKKERVTACPPPRHSSSATQRCYPRWRDALTTVLPR